MNSTADSQLQEIVRRSTSLYSLPSVAMEVVELTKNPDVDTEELRACIECDPALVAKVLRVVNSSMFGLREKVSDLSQALNYLGVQPLKCLVLGFSLPDELMEQASADRLAWYWTRTLTRAVAARLLAERAWKKPGDEALVGGLMQDIGVLAMLRELGSSYAQFLQTAVENGQDISSQERATLGFDHFQVSSALLSSWKLPERFIDAIRLRDEPPEKLARSFTPEYELAKILQLADLMAQLVGGHRLQILPDLVETAALYRGIEKEGITDLVREMQPRVKQFAEILSLSLPEERNYDELLTEAHERMAQQVELAACLGGRGSDDEVCDELLEEAEELTQAMNSFMSSGKSQGAPDGRRVAGQHGAHERTEGEKLAGQNRPGTLNPNPDHEDALRSHIVTAARTCRLSRKELSLFMIELEHLTDLAGSEPQQSHEVVALFDQILTDYFPSNVEKIVTGTNTLSLILIDCDRQQANEYATLLIDGLRAGVDNESDQPEAHPVSLNIGCMTAVNIPKNFEVQRVIESASRCLSAAQMYGGSAFKSIEIY